MNLLNRSETRKFALAVAKVSNRPQFTRVSGAFLDGIEAVVRETVAARVKRHPSIGKTLKG